MNVVPKRALYADNLLRKANLLLGSVYQYQAALKINLKKVTQMSAQMRALLIALMMTLALILAAVNLDKNVVLIFQNAVMVVIAWQKLQIQVQIKLLIVNQLNLSVMISYSL